MAEHGARVWSRETWIYLVGQRLGKELTHTELEAGRDSYWKTLTDNSIFYPDAEIFVKYLKDRTIPLILMTGSDAILEVSSGPTFHYNPTFSDSYKRKRLTILDFGAKEIIIGDPIDKPNKAFFNRVLQVAEPFNITKEKTLFMGDSIRSDLEVPQELGYRTLLVKRN